MERPKPRLAKVCSQAHAHEYVKCGWRVKHEFRENGDRQPYEYILEWPYAIEPTYPEIARAFTMSDASTQLLATFDSLPPKEQHELLIAMLRRSGELPEGIVTDDQLVQIADDLFQRLDIEESNGNDANSG